MGANPAGTGLAVAARSCARCGAGADVDARYCAHCGTEFAAPAQSVTLARPEPATPPGPPPDPPAPTLPAPIVGPAWSTAPGSVPMTGVVVEPSVLGRRASALGWIGVVLGAGGFLVASLGVILLAGQGNGLPDRPAAGGASTTWVPSARFDEMLHDGATVTDGESFEIEVEAVNPADAATGRLWLIIDWRPVDLPAMPGVHGWYRSCVPAGCIVREEPDGTRTVVSWPGLAPGARQVLRVAVAASGLEPGGVLWYRVRTGSGASETELHGTSMWDLDLEVK